MAPGCGSATSPIPSLASSVSTPPPIAVVDSAPPPIPDDIAVELRKLQARYTANVEQAFQQLTRIETLFVNRVTAFEIRASLDPKVRRFLAQAAKSRSGAKAKVFEPLQGKLLKAVQRWNIDDSILEFVGLSRRTRDSINAVAKLAEAVPDFEQCLRLLRRAVHHRFHYDGVIPGVGRSKPFPFPWDINHATVLSEVPVTAKMNDTAGNITTRAKSASDRALAEPQVLIDKDDYLEVDDSERSSDEDRDKQDSAMEEDELDSGEEGSTDMEMVTELLTDQGDEVRGDQVAQVNGGRDGQSDSSHDNKSGASSQALLPAETNKKSRRPVKVEASPVKAQPVTASSVKASSAKASSASARITPAPVLSGNLDPPDDGFLVPDVSQRLAVNDTEIENNRRASALISLAVERHQAPVKPPVAIQGSPTTPPKQAIKRPYSSLSTSPSIEKQRLAFSPEVINTPSPGSDTRQIKRRCVGTSEWLNDEHVNILLQQIVMGREETWTVVDSLVVSKAGNARRVLERTKNAMSILVPLNLDNDHWVLGIIRKRTSELELYDPQGSSIGSIYVKKATAMLHTFLTAYIPDLGTEPVNPCLVAGPRQSNGNDCGVFVIIFAAFLVAGITPPEHPDPRLWRAIVSIMSDPASQIEQKDADQCISESCSGRSDLAEVTVDSSKIAATPPALSQSSFAAFKKTFEETCVKMDRAIAKRRPRWLQALQAIQKANTALRLLRDTTRDELDKGTGGQDITNGHNLIEEAAVRAEQRRERRAEELRKVCERWNHVLEALRKDDSVIRGRV